MCIHMHVRMHSNAYTIMLVRLELAQALRALFVWDGRDCAERIHSESQEIASYA